MEVVGLKGETDLFFYERPKMSPQKTLLMKETDRYNLYKLRYESTGCVEVPALLSVPKNFPPPYPALLYLHYYRGRKESVELFIDDFSIRGYAILSIDIEYHGERKVEGKDILSTDLASDKDAFIQTIIDSRTGLDLLENHPLIDRERLALLGVSLGSLIGVVVSAVDERVKTVVLVVGGGDMGVIVRKSSLDSIVNIRKFIKDNGIDLKDLEKMWSSIEPLRHVQKIFPRPLLMLNGTLDTIIPPESSTRLFEKARGPKRIKWYRGGHNIIGNRSLGLIEEALSWFDLYLKGKKIPQRR
mgnify:CR=1 FL=1